MCVCVCWGRMFFNSGKGSGKAETLGFGAQNCCRQNVVEAVRLGHDDDRTEAESEKKVDDEVMMTTQR